jgi:glutathione S-transferase
MKLVIGNKNYSSWSFRPWIAMKAAGIPFDEEVISLYVQGSRDQILKHSPGGKVPILIDGDTHVWESLAILEYLAERFPAAGLWPADPQARAPASACFPPPLRRVLRACRRSGPTRAKNMAQRGRSCSASSRQRMRCTRQ